jgi:predicted nuclease of predicted toxin-antitoxin system
VRFLIDECLTVQLVSIASDAGYEAYHVAHVGKAGWKDWHVVQYAWDQDFVLVTNNATDFRRLYAELPLHAGLVIFIPNVDGDMQQRLFAGALEQLESLGEPINHVLEVDLEGHEATFTFYELPAPEGSERSATAGRYDGTCDSPVPCAGCC